MTDVHQTAPGRDGFIYAQKPRVTGWARAAIRVALSWLVRAPEDPLSRLDDHLARDIGLDPADLERRRFELPSQTTYHPRG